MRTFANCGDIVLQIPRSSICKKLKCWKAHNFRAAQQEKCAKNFQQILLGHAIQKARILQALCVASKFGPAQRPALPGAFVPYPRGLVVFVRAVLYNAPKQMQVQTSPLVR